MDISRHAKIRAQQRGIPESYVELIVQYGIPANKPGGAIEYCIRKKDKNKIITDLKHLINILDKVTRKAVLVVDDNVVTVYNKQS